MSLFAVTIFLSAFLLFQVQPMLARYILPWFGGTPAVWTTCLLFFQTMLVGGYLYAHGVVSRLAPRTQGIVHLVVLAVSLLLLPITPHAAWRPIDGANPAWRILFLLLRSVGAPYLVLSTTGPLLQGWFARAYPGRSPYRLYALSNVGSLLALLTYPVLVEPHLRLNPQTWMWSACYGLFVVLAGSVAWRMSRLDAATETAPESPLPGDEEDGSPGAVSIVLWLALAACGSLLLLATTNQLCQDVAVVPFLWVVPLALYLLSFILCFDSEWIYVRPLFGGLLAAGLGAAVWLLKGGITVPILTQIAGYGFVLFVGCMVCHGELVRLKPGPRHLTLFYLMVSVGGALSGVFVALVAPRVFHSYVEFPLGLVACWSLFIVVVGRETWRRWRIGDTSPSETAADILLGVFAVGAALYLCWWLHGQDSEDTKGMLARERNFYGVLQVTLMDAGKPTERRTLRHGRILHGYQYTDEFKRLWPTTYYAPTSGLGLAMHCYQWRPRRIGVVGLGTGTLATYARQNDSITFYDINPNVVKINGQWFTHLPDAAERGAHVQILPGDARITMEQQLKKGEHPNYDVLAIDAFSGDAVPVHLLTGECAVLYRQLLQPGGSLLVHVSNRYLDLKPVARGMAAAMNATALFITNPDDEAGGTCRSDWVLISSNPRVLNEPQIVASTTPWGDGDKVLQWTDDFSNLWQVVRRAP